MSLVAAGNVLIDRVRAALAGRYRIERELGRGGMGVVYLGTDRELHREVAIKVLPPEVASDVVRERFVREARIAAGLFHPHLVPLFDVGRRDDLVWLVMAYIDGESVAAKVAREGPQSIGFVRRVVSEVAQGLAYAHARGVVHRDVKPDNILLERDSGRALVTDFGIAKGAGASAPESALTEAGEVVGTARYMSPEQALGEPVDGRSDLYSLGLVAWFMITATHAIPGGSLPAVITAHVRGPNVRFDQIDRALPAALASAMQRCLAPAAIDRFARMEALVEALNLSGATPLESPPAARGLMRDLGRTVATAMAFGAGVLLLGAGRIDPLVWVLGAGTIIWMLLDALEHASRRGVSWSMIHRWMQTERMRRKEEGAREEVGPIASAFYGVVVALAGYLGITVIHGAELRAMTGPIGLYLSAGPAEMQWRLSKFAMVALLVALSVAVARRRGLRLPFGNRVGRVALALMLIGWGAAAARILVGHAAGGGTASGEEVARVSLPLLIALAGLAVLVIGGMAMLAAWVAGRLWVAVAGRTPRDEGPLPRWVDAAGSWLFDRLLTRRRAAR